MTLQKTEDRGQVTEAMSRLRRIIHMDVPLRGRRNLCLLSSVFCLPMSVFCPLSSAYAAEETRPAYVPPPPAVSSGNIVQIIFSLLLVLAAIVLVAWLLKRVNAAQQGPGNQLKVLGGVSIGQRERVVLVEINDTWLVVGVGPGQIRTLHTLPKAEDIGQTENTTFSAHPPENKFAALLSSIVRPQPSDKKHDAP